MHGLQIEGGLTLVVGPYLFDYTRDDSGVNIIAVRHGRMLQLKPDVEAHDDELTVEEPSVPSPGPTK